MDLNCGSLLNFGLLWQRSKCGESPIYQLSPYFLFWTCIPPKINLVLISSLTGKRAKQNLKKAYEILVYEDVDIIWT